MQSSLLLLISLAGLAQADLPVHCNLQDFVGKWKFNFGELGHKETVPQFPQEMGKPFCGHAAPNENGRNLHQLSQFDGVKKSLGKLESFTVNLTLNQKALEDGEHTHRLIAMHEDPETDLKRLGLAKEGAWSSIYDEGLELRSGDKTFMAFALYKCMPGNEKCGTTGDSEDEKAETKGYESMCGRTFVGWYSKKTPGNPKPEFGCWYGEKEDPAEANKVNALVMVGEEFSEQKTPGVGASFIESGSRSRSGSGHRLRSKENFRVYHASQFADGAFPSFAELRAQELRDQASLAGVAVDASGNTEQQKEPLLKGSLVEEGAIPRELPAPMDKHYDLPQSFSENAHCNLDSRPGGENERLLQELEEHEKHFDWRHHTEFHDADGKPKWDTRVIDQGKCGSCYSVSEAYAFQSRINIGLLQRGIDKQVQLSPESILQCSYYNQECHGGYPELVSRHAHDFGIPEEMAQPYEGGDSKKCNTQAYQNEENLWYSKDFGYVGGFYGKCSEARLMKHIKDHGPTTVALEVLPAFGKMVPGQHSSGHHVLSNDDSSVDVHFQVSRLGNGNYFEFLSNPAQLSDMTPWFKEVMAAEQHGGPNMITVDGRKITSNFKSDLQQNLADAVNKHKVTISLAENTTSLADLVHPEDFKIISMTDQSINHWEYLNHAVVLVGWGETKSGRKYWTVRNSWGPNWGQKKDGYAYIRRGENDMGIESEATFAVPDFERGAGKRLVEMHKGRID